MASIKLKDETTLEFVKRICRSVHPLLYSHWSGKFPKNKCIQELKKLRSGFYKIGTLVC
jgi:methyl coenzyme M reductase subunit D